MATPEQQFRDRREAGHLLATRLATYAQRPDVLLLGLPRGGVVVAFEIARELHVQLDVLIVRKLGVPGQEELALGAITSGGTRVLNTDVIHAHALSDQAIEQATSREQREVERREHLYRGDLPTRDLSGRVVILVDDGIATGATMHAAILAVKQQHPVRLIVAVPVAAPPTCDELAPLVDELVCLRRPVAFFAVGLWYKTFPQTSDTEVRTLLERASAGGVATL